ncbi:MAG: type I-C CRISPR-associated protein Cas8c/Csd1 [candidate division Zixibacteria bacterium]|nr:type I-C CRISPR-associated protein Cas8c/Csd1 [candidate division Zixibacteria bacterium]
MIHHLKKYAAKNCPPALPGLTEKDIRWAIVLGRNGKFLEVIEIGEVDSKKNRGLAFPACPNLSQPEMKAGGITKSHFLADTTDVVTLYGADENDEKVKLKHEYFIKFLKDASSAMPKLELAYKALSDSGNLEKIRNSLSDKKAKTTDKISFSIDGEFPLKSTKWHDWWQEFRKSLQKGKSKAKSDMMVSFLTGEIIMPVKTNPKIKHLSDVGGMASGDVVIGFKQDSFCSFGYKQSLNAAMSEEEANVYATALNKLLKEHSRKLAGAKVVHWFKENIEPEDDPLPWLQGVDDTEELNAQHKARELLESIRTGKRPDLQRNFYYALTLSGASGRVMVRDWMEGQFEELVENVNLWFDDLSIVHREGGTLANPPKLMAVLGAMVRDLRDLPPPLITKMWRTAVKAESIPLESIAQALSRAKIDFIRNDPPNHARMGLLKAYHVRKDRFNEKEKSEMTAYLNEDHPDPAYHCGRIMAVLARLQRSALPGVEAGIVQRYYAAASATPALVLGRLVRTSQFHLNKLSDNPGLVRWYENKIAEIWVKIKDRIPSNLTLEDQSLFALGYYHQLAELRPKKEDVNNTAKEENNE